MASNCKLSTAAANAAANAVCALLKDGYLRIYDGKQPLTADMPITDQGLLAELRFDSPAFGDAVNGLASANLKTIAVAKATGIATWARFVRSNGTPVFDCSVGVSGADLNLSSVHITQGGEVSITSYTYQQPKT